MIFQSEHWQYMLQLAKASIAHGFAHDAPLHASNLGVPAPYSVRRGSYVGLTVHGENRGCMGDLDATISLYDSVRTNAYRAAFGDVRFFRPGEGIMQLGSLQVFVFIDKRPATATGLNVHDSIEVRYQNKRAVLLSAYRRSRSNEDFVRIAASKAGIHSNVPLTELRIVALRTEQSKVVRMTDIGEFEHETGN